MLQVWDDSCNFVTLDEFIQSETSHLKAYTKRLLCLILSESDYQGIVQLQPFQVLMV